MTKTKSRKAIKPKTVPSRVPLAARSAADILKTLKVTGAPTTTRSHAPAPAIPNKAPKSEGFAELYHARGGRLWFQVVATPELRAKVEMLKAKAGARTLNDLAARLFDEAFTRYSI